MLQAPVVQLAKGDLELWQALRLLLHLVPSRLILPQPPSHLLSQALVQASLLASLVGHLFLCLLTWVRAEFCQCQNW